jgi:hypothetical protein
MALVLGAGGCGGDNSGSDTPSVSIPAVTSPSVTAPTASLPTSTAAKTGTSGKRPNPQQPDSDTNDLPPQKGSPEADFERQCKQDPSACG